MNKNLFKCWCCQKEISEQAKMCPHCGRDYSEKELKQVKGGISLFRKIFYLFLVYAVIKGAGTLSVKVNSIDWNFNSSIKQTNEINVNDKKNYNSKDIENSLKHIGTKIEFNFETKVGNSNSEWDNSLTRNLLIGFKTLYTDSKYREKGLLAEGLSIDSYPYQNKIRIRFKDLNLMNKKGFTYKNKLIKIYFDDDYFISYQNKSELFPEINSKLQNDIFIRVVEKMKKSIEMKIETNNGSYVIYKVGEFTKLPLLDIEKIKKILPNYKEITNKEAMDIIQRLKK